jgi:hypothetical protein
MTDDQLHEHFAHVKKFALVSFEAGFDNAVEGRYLGRNLCDPGDFDPVSYAAGYEIGADEVNRVLGKEARVVVTLPAVGIAA